MNGNTDCLRIALMVTSLLLLAGCGGGSGGGNPVVQSQSVATTSGGTTVQADGNDELQTGGEQNDSSATDNPSPGAVGDGQNNGAFPFSGQFVVDEYSPGFSPEYEGIIEINPSPLSKTRVLDGSLPRRYADGRTTFRQACGQRVGRIAIAEANGLSTPITPCSSEIPNVGASPTDFRQSNLSPDGSRVAVEARAFINSGFQFTTLVFDIASQEIIATWEGGYNGTWTPDGRLLLASTDGLYLLDANFDNPERLGEINGVVGNPDVSPDGSSVVFEFNQQIWGMFMDGSGARELLTDGSRLRFPVWAPDGSASIAYLAVPSDDKYFGFIFAASFDQGQVYGLDLSPVLEFGSANFLRTVNGPLSWNE